MSRPSGVLPYGMLGADKLMERLQIRNVQGVIKPAPRARRLPTPAEWQNRKDTAGLRNARSLLRAEQMKRERRW